MPYRGTHSVQFPQDPTRNVMLMTGDNMRGKTSFLNAIRWCLYGEALDRSRHKIDNLKLINTEAAKLGEYEMSVSISFSEGEDQLEMLRLVKRQDEAQIPLVEQHLVETTDLTLNGNPQTADEISNIINRIMPSEISRFFLFDGELLQEYESLVVEQARQADQIKERIEQALGVPALINARDELKVIQEDATKAQERDARKDKQTKSKASQLAELLASQELLEKERAGINEQQTEMEKDIGTLQNELSQTEAVQRRQHDIDLIKTNQKNKETALDTIEVDIKDQLKTLWLAVLETRIKDKVKAIKQERDRIQHEYQQFASLQEQQSNLTKSLESEECAYCKQPLKQQERQAIESRIADIQSKLGNESPNYEALQKLTNTVDLLNNIKGQGEISRVLNLSKQKQGLRVELVQLDTRLAQLEEEVKGFDTSEISRKRKRLDQTLVVLEQSRNKARELNEKLGKNKEQQGAISKVIKQASGASSRRSSTKVDIVNMLAQIFERGIDDLRDSVRDQVEQTASSAFMQMTTEQTYQGLEINKNYGLQIKDQHGDIVKLRSAGAEQIVALSLIDGLNKTSGRLAPIIMDTPLGRLDPKHRENVLKYLLTMAEQVVFIVHEGELDREAISRAGIANRIGGEYQIQRISATESTLVRAGA